MLFNSTEFILFFLPTVLIVFFISARLSGARLALTWLTLASLSFYAWWNPAFLLILIPSILFNYFIGSMLNEGIRPIWFIGTHKRLLLAIGIAVNLGVLGYFKYTNFVIDTINSFTGSDYHFVKMVFPLGISFFTFQQIAFLVDSFRGSARGCSFINYCLFVAFYAKLTEGPIVLQSEMMSQFEDRERFRFSSTNLAAGATIFCLGLFKKVVLADALGAHATPIFDAAVHGQTVTFFEAWAGALAYTFQLYFDFSGYSDMAIGLGRMYGIKIPLNFNLPYQAGSIIEFWRRWHITLSRFLRDYLYIPLGGNRKGKVRRYINLMVTMLLGGLWHGAGWTFVVWGGLHGLFLIMNHAWRFLVQRMGFGGNKGNFLTRFVGWFLTFTAVVVAWVLFRAENFWAAMEILRGMAGLNGFVLPTQVMNLIPFGFIKHFIHAQGTVPLLGGGVMGFFALLSYLAISFLVCILLPSMHMMSARRKLALTVLTFAFVIQRLFFSTAPSEFLYFQF